MTLRARIRLGFIIIMVLLILLAVGVVYAQRSQMISQLDTQLTSAAPLNRPAPRFDQEPPEAFTVEDLPDEPISDIYIAAVLPDGEIDVVIQGQLLDSVPDLSELTATIDSGRDIRTIDAIDGTTRFRALAEVDADGVLRVIALSMSDVEETLRQLVITFLIVGVLILATLVGMAWSIMGLGLRPISEVTDAARAIRAGERDRRAPELGANTEAGQLAESFNVMLDQRDLAEDKLRQFVSDASHELRTPLTSIRGYLDLIAAGAFREPGQLDDVVRRMSDESSRMSGLVTTLLQLARLDEQQGLELEEIDLRSLVHDVVSNSRAAHPDRSIEAVTGAQGVTAAVDAEKVRQLVAGLVDNALIHGPEASVRVHLEADAKLVKLVVADSGPGMSQDDADRVFDRFYRGDSSRSRTTADTSGSGLGLAIAKSIAEAHHGTIALETAPGEGCTFTATLPRFTENSQQARSRGANGGS